MQNSLDATAMDFGPNLFGGEDKIEFTSAADNAAAPTNDAMAGMASDLDKTSREGSVATTLEVSSGQVGNNTAPSECGANPGGDTEQAASQTTSGKPAVATRALSSVKAAVKIFESISGFDEQSANQRAIVRDLMLKQSEAMELKLQGKRPPEGHDFDAIAKQLRRENNRLDTQLEGKETLFGKARKSAEIAIGNLQHIIIEINRMEEEG